LLPREGQAIDAFRKKKRILLYIFTDPDETRSSGSILRTSIFKELVEQIFQNKIVFFLFFNPVPLVSLCSTCQREKV
jgi:hypothetical protein